jgi:hypothetical protein
LLYAVLFFFLAHSFAPLRGEVDHANLEREREELRGGREVCSEEGEEGGI